MKYVKYKKLKKNKQGKIKMIIFKVDKIIEKHNLVHSLFTLLDNEYILLINQNNKKENRIYNCYFYPDVYTDMLPNEYIIKDYIYVIAENTSQNRNLADSCMRRIYKCENIGAVVGKDELEWKKIDLIDEIFKLDLLIKQNENILEKFY